VRRSFGVLDAGGKGRKEQLQKSRESYKNTVRVESLVCVNSGLVSRYHRGASGGLLSSRSRELVQVKRPERSRNRRVARDESSETRWGSTP